MIRAGERNTVTTATAVHADGPEVIAAVLLARGVHNGSRAVAEVDITASGYTSARDTSPSGYNY